MITIIISQAVERLCLEEKRAGYFSNTGNNRANKGNQLRQELKSMKRRLKEAHEKERVSQTALNNILWKKLMTLKRV